MKNARVLLTSLLAGSLAACVADPGVAGPRADAGPIFDRDGLTGPMGDVTYYADARPILARHCEGCHVEGGIAPFPLDTYEIASSLSMRIAEVTRARIMPPYPANASGECNTFRDARWLSEDEIATLEAWYAGGALEGDPTTPAPERMVPPSLGAGEATHTLALDAAYTPQRTTDDTPNDEIRCFVVDPGIATEGFLTAYEVIPGDARVVHHVILFEPESAAAAGQASDLDTAEPGAGYACNGGPGVNAHPVVLWAPGGGAMHFPSGTGLRVATHPMILQVHYNISAGSFPDRTQVELVVVPSGVREARILAISDPASLYLAARSTEATATATWTAPADGTIWGVLPHMHQRGRTLHVALGAGASEQCVLDVDRWDFNWQLGYYYETPIDVTRGQRIRLDCTFDTSTETDVVTWGEGTANEMCLNYFYVTGS